MSKDKNHQPVWVNLPTKVYDKLEAVAAAKGLKPSQYMRTNIISILNKIKDK